MKSEYIENFNEITASEGAKQKAINTLICYAETQKSVSIKPQKRFVWNVRHRIIAATTAVVMIFCAIFIPIMLNNIDSGNNPISEKTRVKAIFENAVYIPALNDIMPASVTNVVNFDTASTATSFDATAAQLAFSQALDQSSPEIKTMDVSELNADYSYYFESLIGLYNYAKWLSDCIKYDSAYNLEYVADFGMWVSASNNSGNNCKIKYEKTVDAVIYYYAVWYNDAAQPNLQKAIVYNDGSAECFFWNPNEVNQYFRYNGKNSFVMVSEYQGTAHCLEMERDGENFVGIQVSLASSEGSYTGLESVGQITYMKGDAKEFYIAEYNYLFDESKLPPGFTHPSQYNWIGIIKDNSTCYLSNNGGVRKGSVILSMDALDGIEKIYYSENEYGERVFEALKIVDGEMYHNLKSYRWASILKPAPNVYTGWFEVALLDIDDYSDVIKICNNALPLGLKIKESKNFDFSVYPVLTAEIESYKIKGIATTSDLVLIENGHEIYARIVAFINAMRYEVPSDNLQE